MSIAASFLTSIVTASIVSPHPPSASLTGQVDRVRQVVTRLMSEKDSFSQVGLVIEDLQRSRQVKSVVVFDDSQRVVARLTRGPTQQFPTTRSDMFPLQGRDGRLGTMMVNYQPLRRADDALVRFLLIAGGGAVTYGFCLLQVTALLTSLSASLKDMRDRISNAIAGKAGATTLTTQDLTGLHSPFERLLAAHELQVRRLDEQLRQSARQQDNADLRLVVANEQLLEQTHIINHAITRFASSVSAETRSQLAGEVQRACQALLKAGSLAHEAAAEEGELLPLDVVVTSVVDLWRHEVEGVCDLRLELQETPVISKLLPYSQIRFIVRSILRLLADRLKPSSANLTVWHNPEPESEEYPNGAYFIRLDFAPAVAEIDLYDTSDSPNSDIGVEHARRIVERSGGAMTVVAEKGRASALVISLPDMANTSDFAQLVVR